MHSLEYRDPKPSIPQETQISVDYDRVAANLKSLRENEDGEKQEADLNEQYLQDLAAVGLDLEDLSESQVREIEIEASREEDHEGKRDFKSRLGELQKTKLPLRDVLNTLKQEFGESMDEETRVVIDNFQSLVSPSVIPDEQEREAVEILFATQSIKAFTPQSFTGFVETIYEVDAISEETKQRIEEKFGIPRTPIKTGAELAEWTLKKDENGEYLHSSPETALEFRKGVKTHVDKQGNTLLTIAGNARTEPMSISPERLKNGESLASLANYSLIRGVVFDEFSQMTNLFGGGAEDELGTPSESTMDDANTFARMLIGNRSPDSILSKSDLVTLRQALKALHDPNQSGETAVGSQLHDLGILNRGNLQWLKIEEIGKILRSNQNFRTFELAHSGNAHRLLTKELKARSGHETEQTNTMHGIGRTMHGLLALLAKLIKRNQQSLSGAQAIC